MLGLLGRSDLVELIDADKDAIMLEMYLRRHIPSEITELVHDFRVAMRLFGLGDAA